MPAALKAGLVVGFWAESPRQPSEPLHTGAGLLHAGEGKEGKQSHWREEGGGKRRRRRQRLGNWC